MKRILLLWIWIALGGLIIGCQKQQEPIVPASKQREFANVLYNQQLYPQAIEAYKQYLNNYSLSPGERANVSYQIANIYFDKIHDYENALAYYLRIRYLYPDDNLQKEVSRKIVACLERLQRSAEAQQEMEQTAALDESQKPKSKPGEVVAKIGDRTITIGDLNYEINRLPSYVRSQIKDRKSKVEFLKQYIAQELLYDSAKRKGLDKDKEVIEGVFQAKKALMAQKLLQQEIEASGITDKYTNADVETYYKANKEKYAERDKNGKIKRIPPFQEVAKKVAQDFIQEKQQEAYQQLIERLMKAENVVIYEDKIR